MKVKTGLAEWPDTRADILPDLLAENLVVIKELICQIEEWNAVCKPMIKLVKCWNDLIKVLQHVVSVETDESVREVQLCNDTVI